MKKLHIPIFAILISLVMAAAGCKSAPPAEPEVVPVPEETQEAPAVESKPVDDQLTALRDRAEELHKTGVAYGIDRVKPESWGEASSLRDAGLKAYGSDYDASADSFTRAIALYEKIIDESFAAIVDDLERQIREARASAVGAGADSYYPEQFSMADAVADDARAKKESGDLAAAYDAGQIALMRYLVLDKAMQVLANKQAVDQNDFAQYAPEDYEAAHGKYDEAVSLYGVSDAACLEAVDQALLLSEKVLNAGYKVWAEKARAQAVEIRDLCDSIKASRSMKAEYDEALGYFKAAQSSAEANSWHAAYQSWTDASHAFTVVHQAVLLKKNAADLAIANARARQDESSALAQQADELLPLPPDAEGFSDDETVAPGTEIESPAADEAAPLESNETEAPAADEVESVAEEPASEEPESIVSHDPESVSVEVEETESAEIEETVLEETK